MNAKSLGILLFPHANSWTNLDAIFGIQFCIKIKQQSTQNVTSYKISVRLLSEIYLTAQTL